MLIVHIVFVTLDDVILCCMHGADLGSESLWNQDFYGLDGADLGSESILGVDTDPRLLRTRYSYVLLYMLCLVFCGMLCFTYIR